MAVASSVLNDPLPANGPTASENRYYTTKLGANYFLPSDASERERLQLQHETLKKEVFKSLLPPVNLRSGDIILDAGTGSGAWALDIAPSVPLATIIAFDVEDNLFPHAPPSNVHFSVKSVLHLPAEWEGTVALAHQRLLLAALGLEEWKVALAELYRVLKPGGTIRLEELAFLNVPSDIYGVDWETKLPQTALCLKLTKALYDARGRSLTVYTEIPQLMKDVGFAYIKTDEGTMWMGPGNEAQGGHDNFMGVFRAFKQPLMPLGLIDSEAYDDFLAKLDVEWQKKPRGVEFLRLYRCKVDLSETGEGDRLIP